MSRIEINIDGKERRYLFILTDKNKIMIQLNKNKTEKTNMSIKKIIKRIPGVMKLRLLLSAFQAPTAVIIKNRRLVLKYKNIYKGKRCFIIGNGPSLKPEDLDRIQGEITFAANRIYMIFPKTSWRPTFYCVQDENVLLEMEKRDLEKTANESQSTFMRMHSFRKIKKNKINIRNLVYIPIWVYQLKSRSAPFTKKADRYIYDGSTVTYMSMQLAAYMGFQEIYLIGVDNNFPYRMEEDGKVIVNDLNVDSHFYDGAENNRGNDAWKRRSNNYKFVTNSYQSAEDFSRKDGTFRIYNATRGGILEVFERVDLDEVIGNAEK